MRFRDPTQNGDPPPKYGSNGNMYTLCIHTGGSIHRGIDYVGERNLYKFDHVKRDLFTIDSLKNFSGYMDGSEIEVLYTKNDEGQIEQINTENEFQKYSGKAVSECRELDIYIVSEGKRDSDVQGGSESDNANDSGSVLGNEHASAHTDFVDNKDNIEEGGGVIANVVKDNIKEGTGVGEDSRQDVVVVDDGSGDDDMGESEDDFNSVKDSDSEDEGCKCLVYKQTTVYDPQLELNMIFSNKKEFIDVVHSNAVLNRRAIKITKNDKSRVYAKCRGDGCRWEIRAIIIPGEGTFRVRAYIPTHSCPESYRVRSIKPRLLSRKYGYQFKNDPKRKVSDFKNDMSNALGVHITNHQAYKCRKLALADQYDSVDEQYMLLWDYAQEIRRTNPGSTVVIDSDQSSGSHRFDMMYVCLNAVKEGFLTGCRPLIGLDGYRLKGPHKGMLLSAVGVDPNNNMFPIAYAVVSKESGDTWEWFLSVLKVDLKIVDDTVWTFISDKQKGLVLAIQNIFPNSFHRFCVRRLHSNMRNAGFGGQAFKIALNRAAKATTVDEFNRKMDDIKELSEMLFQGLNELPPEHWSRSHFNSIPKCDILMNKLCESYKNSILSGRGMPILSMLEWLMEHLMQRFQRNKDRANRGTKWKGELCPRIQKQINESTKRIEDCTALKGDDKHYQVRCIDGSQYDVDLENWTCGCRKWDMTGIPCIHAIRAICCQGLKPEDFTHECYRVSTYRMVYDQCIMPINGRSEWVPYEFIPLLPPLIDRRRNETALVERQKKRARGRPNYNPFRLKRNQVTVRCSKCQRPGHNKKRCENGKAVNHTEGRVYQITGDNSRVIDDDVPNQTVHLLEPPAVSEDDGNVIKKARKRYRTRSFASRKTVNLLEPLPMYDQPMQSEGSEDEYVIKKARKRYKKRSKLAASSGKTVNLQEPSTMDDQLMQRHRPEDDDQVIKKAGKRYSTRSNLASFASGKAINSLKQPLPMDDQYVQRQMSEDDDHALSNLASVASGIEKSTMDEGNKSTEARKFDHQPLPMDDQLVQRERSEDVHVTKKAGKRYATRSYLASFASGNEKSA